ncbi:MAG: hypothetical protein D6758_09985, partial [Gammaproteobacteria bacterium]
MKQQVNLYVEELRPRKVVLPAGMIAVVWLLGLLVMLAVGGWMSLRAASAVDDLEAARETRDQLVSRVEQVKERLASRKVSAGLLERQSQLRGELDRAR